MKVRKKSLAWMLTLPKPSLLFKGILIIAPTNAPWKWCKVTGIYQRPSLTVECKTNIQDTVLNPTCRIHNQLMTLRNSQRNRANLNSHRKMSEFLVGVALSNRHTILWQIRSSIERGTVREPNEPPVLLILPSSRCLGEDWAGFVRVDHGLCIQHPNSCYPWSSC